MDIWGIIGGLGVGGLLGTIGTQWATGRREKATRRVAFKKQQLEGFYGPLLAAHKEIRARGELRVKLQQALDAQHTDAMFEAGMSGGSVRHDRVNAATDAHLPAIVTNIQDEGQTMRDVLMPRYQSMIDTFRDKMWLAEPETREYFDQLVKFVDVWDKILADKLPRSIAPAINHTEANLKPFIHISKRYTIDCGAQSANAVANEGRRRQSATNRPDDLARIIEDAPMLHAYLVDNPRLPSPAFLKLVSFDDDVDIVGSVQAEINAHNDSSDECRAGGALIWFDDRRDRLQYVAPELRLHERFGDIAKLHGRITCASGRSYKYFGECFGWIPGGRSFWRAWLYTTDKKFDYDDVRTSKDQLAQLEGELLNMTFDISMVKELADDQLRQAIERWDGERTGNR